MVTMITSSWLRICLLNNVEKAKQMTSTSLQHSEHSREQKKCWTDVEANFKGFSTLSTSIQRGGNGAGNAFNIVIQQNGKDVEAIC